MTFAETIEPEIRAYLKGRSATAARISKAIDAALSEVYAALVSMESRDIVGLAGGRPHRGNQRYLWSLKRELQ